MAFTSVVFNFTRSILNGTAYSKSEFNLDTYNSDSEDSDMDDSDPDDFDSDDSDIEIPPPFDNKKTVWILIRMYRYSQFKLSFRKVDKL